MNIEWTIPRPPRMVPVKAMLWLAVVSAVSTGSAQVPATSARPVDLQRGIVAVIGVPENDRSLPLQLCKTTDLSVYVQTADSALAASLRQRALEQGWLGRRLVVVNDASGSIQLADNVADRVLVFTADGGEVDDQETMRVLRPRGELIRGSEVTVKPVPPGIDSWSHPYHGPDNNPNSSDQLVRGDLQTQFIGFPKFSPMPEQTVIAGGRIYKAMGHIAHKANQNEMLNTLLCINAFNGTILWRRPLSPGFMLHRNTMIATEEGLLMGDHESCKVFAGTSGELVDEIKVDQTISDGPVWKWMALRDGVLYALVGNPEVKIETQRAIRRGLGHWPWGMWDGHDYDDPRTSFGFGRTLVAIDLKTGDRRWHYRDEEFLDARAVCMNDGYIFCYCPGKFLACVDRYTGQLQWKNSDPDLLEAIADNQAAQHYTTGYATTCYLKCDQEHLFFAGPQRAQMVVASTKDGGLQWTHPIGNLQLVLRSDGIWAAGPQKSENGIKLDYQTGEVLATFPARRACTRATGCADSIFYRASGGTVRVLTDSNTAQHIDPMRPPCQDGVLVAEGHLYWGPWMCGCQLSLYGNIALRPTGSGASSKTPRLIRPDTEPTIEPVAIRDGDWADYRGGPGRTDVSQVPIPNGVSELWQVEVSPDALPTAPVTADGRVFVADRRGVVQAFDADGKLIWKSFTAGPIYYPPVVAEDRVFVGAADGRVHAFSASSGELCWSFRVGPAEHRIPVYEQLVSTWPVAGGVVVHQGTVYAAAGITHYDGTHVVALDAASGELIASNSSSGTLEQQVNNGISLQGNLTIVDDELRFLAGGVYETARYDLQTLACLNQPRTQVSSQFRTAFYPYYPEYGKYVSLDYQCQDGCQLSHDASYEGSQFVNLARLPALPPGAPKPVKEAARWVRRGGKLPDPIWRETADRRFTSFVVTESVLLAGGHAGENFDEPYLVAIDTADGSDRWIEPLPALPVKGGISIGHDGRLYASLENGRLLCFAPSH